MAPATFVATLLTSQTDGLPAGTSVGGVDVGGLSPEQALRRVRGRVAAVCGTAGCLSAGRSDLAAIGRRRWAAGELRAPLREVYASQEPAGVTERLASAPAVGNVTTPLVAYDRETARGYLQGLSAGFDQPSANAALALRNDGRAILTPSQPGRVVDVERALADLEDGLSRRAVGHVVDLRYRQDVPAVTTSDAEAALDTVRRMIGEPIVLVHGTGGWTLEPDQLRQALVVDSGDAGISPRIEVTRFNDLFQKIEDTLAAEARHGEFDFDEKQDRVLAFQPGHPGQRIDRPALEEAILAVVKQSGERRVDVPIILLNKEFDTSANPLGIKDLLGVGSSIYKGSPDYRDHNIAVGAAKLDGMIVRPGDTFSFNRAYRRLYQSRGLG